MAKCPLCGEDLSNHIEENATEGQAAEFLAGFRTCFCGWEGHVSIGAEEVFSKDQNISVRTKNGYSLERSFANRCRQNGWVIEKGNLFATYILNPKHLRNEYAISNSKIIKKAINTIVLRQQLLTLFAENKCEPDTFYPDEAFKVYELPDFIVLAPFDKKPFWVEVKRGSSKLSPRQRWIATLLKDIGFSVLLYRGGPISKLKKQIEIQ